MTITAPARTSTRERSSKFIAFAYPVESADDIKPILDALRKEFYDATHICWAARTGCGKEEASRSSDDGEPSGTAGRPIMGQIMSASLTNVLVAVVRYFGGTKLGVPGLIAAYKEAAAEVIAECKTTEKTVDEVFRVTFAFEKTNDVMKIVKDMQPVVLSQVFDNRCAMELSIRSGRAAELREKLLKCEGLGFEQAGGGPKTGV